jgi:hypothetical protein
MKEQNISIEALNHLYMDTSFSGQPAQCDEETCEIMRKTLHFRPTIGLEESNQVSGKHRLTIHMIVSLSLTTNLGSSNPQYKYLFDVDGNGWSGRFHRLMSTRSLVLKSTTFPEYALQLHMRESNSSDLLTFLSLSGQMVPGSD